MKTKYKLGTRKSLLALTQSAWVARELMKLNPGIEIELIGIETKGDIILDKPLSQIDGKEFFTAELDHALMRGDVDLTVHSMKDLSLDRPPQMKLAAIPPREFAQDVIIFHESVIDRLKRGAAVRIGTSSPRRLTLIPKFLKEALPRFDADKEPLVEFVEIRGNVNTRLSRVHEPENSPKKLDGVVLAFAGLERLAQDETASKELNRLRESTRIMVLPLRLCPSAPAQGALAIEARTNDSETLAMIKKIHDPITQSAVEREREILNEWGGGCHQKLGASAVSPDTLFIQGVKPSGEWVNEVRTTTTNQISDFTKIEASDVFNFKSRSLSEHEQNVLLNAHAIFVAHSRAYDYLEVPTALAATHKKQVWVSGTKSWFKLARHGVWVEGSVDGQGFKTMAAFQHKKLLKLTHRFLFLTHLESEQTPGAEHLATYQHEFKEIPEKLEKNQKIYWSSSLPFRTLWSKLGADFMLKKTHASGPGKTADCLTEFLKPHGVKPHVSTFES